jgi:hypothetical protein
MPTFATGVEAHPIRVYLDGEFLQNTQKDDASGEDSDSGMEELGLIEQTDEQRLARNERYLADYIEGWTLSSPAEPARNGRPIQTVIQPTLSKMSTHSLHPNLYTKIRPSATLDEMAQVLGTYPSWEEIYNAVVAENASVNTAFRRLRSLGDREPAIRVQFVSLVQFISLALGIDLFANSEKYIVVGGMLVREELNTCGKTDQFFQNENERPVLASEVKTNSAFPYGRFWHSEFRTSQILPCAYALGCPTEVFTPMQFKFFFESDRRDMVFTFPAAQDPAASQFLNASLMGPMGRDFLKAICICLLSPRAKLRPGAGEIGRCCAVDCENTRQQEATAQT